MVNLLSFDMMSPSIAFHIKKSDSFKSSIGFILTIMYIICIILAFIGFVRDIYERAKPVVFYNKELTNETWYKFNNTNFVTTVYESTTWKPIDDFDRKFVIYWELFWNYPGGYDTTIFYFTNCTKQTTDEFKENLVNDPSNYKCLVPGKDVFANGTRENANYYSSRLNIDYCENGKFEKSDCLAIDQIKKTVPSRMTHQFIFYDYYADSTSYDTPIVRTFSNNVANGAIDNFSRIITGFSNIEYETDIGWIIEKRHIEVVAATATSSSLNLATPGGNIIFPTIF